MGNKTCRFGDCKGYAMKDCEFCGKHRCHYIDCIDPVLQLDSSANITMLCLHHKCKNTGCDKSKEYGNGGYCAVCWEQYKKSLESKSL